MNVLVPMGVPATKKSKDTFIRQPIMLLCAAWTYTQPSRLYVYDSMPARTPPIFRDTEYARILAVSYVFC